MYPVWQFTSEVWDESGLVEDRTISGERFAKLMDLCFAQADLFSFGVASWAYATDRRLEQALQPFQTGSLRTGSWFCYRFTQPALEIRLYRAEEEAKQAVLRHVHHLFLWEDEKHFCSLEDLCFFRGGQLFFGTVTHERMCYAHILSQEFGACLKALGEWEDGSDNECVFLDLNEFQESKGGST